MTVGAPLVLAQAIDPPVGATGGAAAGDLLVTLLPYLLVIVALTIVGGIIMMVSRRRLDAPGDASPIGFSLDDLKELRDQGELTDEEYERARSEVIARARRAFRVKDPGPKRGPVR